MSDPSTARSHPDVLLDAHGICKSFPGVRALDNVDFALRRGTLHALVGENGAGKSTLMNILAGVLSPEEGQILLNGRAVRFSSPRDAQRAGVSIIHQELNLVPDMSVAENIFLGHERRNRIGLIDYRQMYADARKLLGMLNSDIDPRTIVGRLRVGSQQLVEIAKALSFDAKVIIMDEPTSAISEQEVASLFRLIHQLKQRGVGIIYITHKLAELAAIADEITVLRDGQLIATKPFGEVTHDELVRMMVGRDIGEWAPKRTIAQADIALEVCGLSLRNAERSGTYVIHNVSFGLRCGEVLGIFGLMGAGRTELLQAIFGLHPDTASGTIRVFGKPVAIRSPQDAILAGLALAPEDRKSEGLVLTMTVAENTTLTCLERASRFGFTRAALERRLVEEFVRKLAIKTRGVHEKVRNLSGGNQQKVVLSKWLATEPRILLLDEPTRGIDIHAKGEIYKLIDELAENGLGIVVVSSELPEILAISDRILVLAEGRVTAEFDRATATEETILTAALPRGKAAQAELV